MGSGSHRALLAAVSWAIAFCCAQAATAAEPPATTPDSAVVILTDDQRWDTLWAMPIVLDRLVSRGVVFNNAYVSTPQCSPTRASLLSGGYLPHDVGVLTNEPINGGVWNFRDDDGLALRLSDRGYKTAMIGKYMHGERPGEDSDPPPGWTHFSPSLKMDAQKLADEAVTFLEENGDSPFLVYLSTYAPHYPSNPEERDQGLFPTFTYRGRGYYEEDLSDKPGWVRRGFARFEANHYCSVEEQDEFHRDELRTLQSVDRAVGELYDYLQQTGRLQRTVFILTSDNGLMWGEHGQFTKAKPYDEAIRVPLVVTMPGIEPRQDDHLVVVNLDIPATLLDLAGAASGGEGLSLLPLLGGLDPPWRDHFLIESYSSRWCGIVGILSGRLLKYVEHAENPTVEYELYDLTADPYELESLHQDPSYAPQRELLAQELSPLRGVAITTFKLPDGEVGQLYSAQLEAWGGDGAYTWSIADGSLPPGLELDPGSGWVSGTPVLPGLYSVWIRVADTRVAVFSGQPQQHVQRFNLEVGPLQTASFESIPKEDGWVREDREKGSVGARLDDGARSVKVGDDARNRQLKAVLSFITRPLPDTATVVSAKLILYRRADIGCDPFRSLDKLEVEVNRGVFSGSAALTTTDFQAIGKNAVVLSVGQAGCAGDTFSIGLDEAVSAINLRGRTQVRISFFKDDDNDRSADMTTFFSGDHPRASRRPRLVVRYY